MARIKKGQHHVAANIASATCYQNFQPLGHGFNPV
jgi:hypothetical protein